METRQYRGGLVLRNTSTEFFDSRHQGPHRVEYTVDPVCPLTRPALEGGVVPPPPTPLLRMTVSPAQPYLRTADNHRSPPSPPGLPPSRPK